MKLIDLSAIYTLWLRETKRYVRARSRVVGSLGMPLMFLIFLGEGFSRASLPGLPPGLDYVNYLSPGIIAMILLFGSMFAGISVLWDRQFGFLKEVMVSPVSRTSIVLGRVAGGVTMALSQALLMLVASLLMGLKTTAQGVLYSLPYMALLSAAFVGLGLAFASKMEDMHGFTMIMNFLMFPLFFLSGALFPLSELPRWVARLTLLNPMTYGVDALRGALVGVSDFPLLIDALALAVFSIVMVGLGAYLFESVEVD
ncbi:MAG: multidrug ABC transporter permease [Methanobacteriota archaeon]|nr:MAG: multidrug ABC transporter permease [Euryarchaeota archaeon]